MPRPEERKTHSRYPSGRRSLLSAEYWGMVEDASSVIAAGVNPKHITSVIADIRDRFIFWPPIYFCFSLVQGDRNRCPVFDESRTQASLACGTNSTDPLKHQFELEIEMWQILLNQMDRRIEEMGRGR